MSRTVTILVVASAAISTIAIVTIVFFGYQLLFAPSPEVFQLLPVPLAANPATPADWDFSNQHPILHPGDQLVGEFRVCYGDIFGGGVDVESRRSIISLDGTTRAALRPMDVQVTTGCRVTRSVIDTIPDHFPSGTYRVLGNSLAIARFYSRRVDWTSVPFDVVQ